MTQEGIYFVQRQGETILTAKRGEGDETIYTIPVYRKKHGLGSVIEFLDCPYEGDEPLRAKSFAIKEKVKSGETGYFSTTGSRTVKILQKVFIQGREIPVEVEIEPFGWWVICNRWFTQTRNGKSEFYEVPGKPSMVPLHGVGWKGYDSGMWICDIREVEAR